MMKTAMKAAILTALLLAPALPAQAHGIYITERSKQIVLIYGEGADDLDMVKREPLIDTVAAYDAEAKPIKAQHRISGLAMLIETETRPRFVTAILQNGVWSRMKGGEYEKKGLDEMPGADISTRTSSMPSGFRARSPAPSLRFPARACRSSPPARSRRCWAGS